MPGARCTRGLVCHSAKKCAHEHTGAAEASDIPCAMALRLISCSPRSGRARCHRHRAMREPLRNLTPASGRQDHTTSPYASAPFVKGASASTASHPALVTTRETPLVPGRDRINILLIWVRRQQKFGKTEIWSLAAATSLVTSVLARGSRLHDNASRSTQACAGRIGASSLPGRKPCWNAQGRKARSTLGNMKRFAT